MERYTEKFLRFVDDFSDAMSNVERYLIEDGQMLMSATIDGGAKKRFLCGENLNMLELAIGDTTITLSDLRQLKLVKNCWGDSYMILDQGEIILRITILEVKSNG